MVVGYLIIALLAALVGGGITLYVTGSLISAATGAWIVAMCAMIATAVWRLLSTD